MSKDLDGTSSVIGAMSLIPERLERNFLRGGMRAGARVIADGAKRRATSARVRKSIGVGTSVRQGEVIARVRTKGPGSTLALWAEMGTEPHVIEARGRDAEGNRLGRKRAALAVRKGVLVINGRFVGHSVQHPGASAEPFLRPAYEQDKADALEAIGEYIRQRLVASGYGGTPPPDDADDDE